jgi:hypothetical protein
MTDTQAANKPSCQFVKTDGQLCKRAVEEGEDRCWQHAADWSHKWKSLTRSQSLGFILVVASLVVGLPSLYFSFAGWHEGRGQKTAPATLQSGEVALPIEVTSDDFSKTFFVQVGGYQDFQWRSEKIRVDLKEIVKDKVPSGFDAREVDQAAIYVDTSGGLVYGGPETTQQSTNQFSVPVLNQNEEEPRSIYWFHIGDHYFEFCRIVVDHIDRVSGRVTMRIFFHDANK